MIVTLKTQMLSSMEQMADQQIPIQPVENPILCSPYAEPDQHRLYDTRTGIPSLGHDRSH